MNYGIKTRLCILNKSQAWLLGELHKKGYTLTKGTLSKAIKSKSPSENMSYVLEDANRIINEETLRQQGLM